MKQIKWFDRVFDFAENRYDFPSLMERLSGTHIRLAEKVKGLSESELITSPSGKWSVKEQIGHLADLEPLWQGRLEDILNGEAAMRPTDLQNTITHLANHNATPLPQLLSDFHRVRLQTIDRLKDIREEDIPKFALHPRLMTPMHTLDHLFFVAEHDDHHLASITKLLNGK